ASPVSAPMSDCFDPPSGRSASPAKAGTLTAAATIAPSAPARSLVLTAFMVNSSEVVGRNGQNRCLDGYHFSARARPCRDATPHGRRSIVANHGGAGASHILPGSTPPGPAMRQLLEGGPRLAALALLLCLAARALGAEPPAPPAVLRATLGNGLRV